MKKRIQSYLGYPDKEYHAHKTIHDKQAHVIATMHDSQTAALQFNPLTKDVKRLLAAAQTADKAIKTMHQAVTVVKQAVDGLNSAVTAVNTHGAAPAAVVAATVPVVAPVIAQVGAVTLAAQGTLTAAGHTLGLVARATQGLKERVSSVQKAVKDLPPNYGVVHSVSHGEFTLLKNVAHQRQLRKEREAAEKAKQHDDAPPSPRRSPRS